MLFSWLFWVSGLIDEHCQQQAPLILRSAVQFLSSVWLSFAPRLGRREKSRLDPDQGFVGFFWKEILPRFQFGRWEKSRLQLVLLSLCWVAATPRTLMKQATITTHAESCV